MTKKVIKGNKKPKDRKDWTEHHAKIRDEYIKIVAVKKRCPTLHELADSTKYSILTIRRHLSELKFDSMRQDMRVLTPDVLLAIANSAKKGNPSSQKLWLQVMEGFSESANVNHTNDGKAFDVMTPVIIGSVDESNKPKSPSE